MFGLQSGSAGGASASRGGGPGDQSAPGGSPLVHSKDPLQSKGQTQNAAVRGARQDKGSERVIEIRGPARLGDRAKTPYQKVLPQYKQAAEKAINRENVPKNRRKLVRDYFDSIDKGK